MESTLLNEKSKGFHLPLYVRVLIGVFLGASLGLLFGARPYLFGLISNEQLGQLGMVVIRLLKALAVPLILFAILDAFCRTTIRLKHGGKLILICLVNVSVAMTIGLTLMNLLRPGEQWQGKMEKLMMELHLQSSEVKPPTESLTLNPLKNLAGYVPESLLDPFLKGNVISVVLIAILGGAALRHVKERQAARGQTSIQVVERLVEAIYQILTQMLGWVVQMVPFAVFGVVAHVVGKAGLQVLGALWIFLAVILLGLGIHSLLYYPLVAWLVGKKSPRLYLGKGADAIIMGLSTNSSLATVPVTLQCLKKMGVSDRSARLSACVGTNLNNDGITLYEAMAALFLAQAIGHHLSGSQQVTVVLASIMAGIGMAGVPEAGLIVLPLVLSAVGLPEAVVMTAIPLILTVDWIIARGRSFVNVMSDMLVAILLDRGTPVEEVEPGPEEAEVAAASGSTSL